MVNSSETTARLVTGPITNLMSNGGNSGAFTVQNLTTEQIKVAIPTTLLQEDTTDTNGDSTSLGNQHGIGNEDVVITIRAKAIVP